MNYLEEYIEKLMALQRGEKVKINVHFVASEPLTSFCYEINQQIAKHNVGLINMSVESIIVPHISLFNGYVDNIESLEEVFRVVREYAQKTPCFYYDATNLYFKQRHKGASQYLFIDSLQTNYLSEQKEILDKLLQPVTTPNEWDMKSERPHLTVGCYRNITAKTREFIDSCGIIPSCKISQIGVSLSGKHGVCLSLLKAFDLPAE